MELCSARRSPEGTRYWRRGSGTPLVLIHGVGLDATMWQAQLEALPEQFDIIAYDMLGHGESPRPSEHAGLEEYALQLSRLLDHLGIDRACVLGFSMGGLVARAFALQHPERLAALIILSSVFERNEEQKSGVQARVRQTYEHGPSANIDEALKRWFSPAYQQAHPETIAAIHKTMRHNDPLGYYRSYALFASEDMYGAERLANLSAPTLIATGELDQGSTPAMAHRLAEQLPNAEVHVFEGQRHMVPVEAPPLVNGVVRRFLSNVSFHPSLEETSS